MKRREFIAMLSASVSWPLAARAQQSSTAVLGFLHVGAANSFPHLVAALRQGLKGAGIIEGENVVIQFHWAEGRYDRLPTLAADLVQRRVAVIVAGGGEGPALAAKAATVTIPIVFNVGGDPVKLGLVASLSRPGGNVTGINIFTTELASKRLGLLHQLMPASTALLHLVNPNFPSTDLIVADVESAARTIGRRVILQKASSESDIDAAFATIPQERPGALLVGADPFFNSRRDQIVALARRYVIPAMYEQREFALAGGLMSYGTSLTEAYRQMGIYAGQILKGANPAELPVRQSTKFELVINLKTAKTIGLAIPDSMQLLADEVIE
jgi:putative tryptophan/tyrosine transport system substrate-binding protein